MGDNKLITVSCKHFFLVVNMSLPRFRFLFMGRFFLVISHLRMSFGKVCLKHTLWIFLKYVFNPNNRE